MESGETSPERIGTLIMARRRLTKSQLKRIKAIEAVLADVYPNGLGEVIATDRSPEAAIADWERLAAAYEEQAQGRPAEERKDVFEILLIMSCGVSASVIVAKIPSAWKLPRLAEVLEAGERLQNSNDSTGG